MGLVGLGIGFLVVLGLMSGSKSSSAAVPGAGPAPGPMPPMPPVPPMPPQVTPVGPGTPPPPPEVTPTLPVGPVAPSSTKYVVKSGDTGEKIALAFTGSKNRWPELVTANPSLKDPVYGLRIFAGQTINLPPSWVGLAGASTTPIATPIATPAQPVPSGTPALSADQKYLVKSGDTGEKIALAFTGNKNRWPELVTANPSLKDPTYGLRIFAGQRINIPSSWVPQPTVMSGRRWVV